MKFLVNIFCISIFAALLSGCKTKCVEVPTVRWRDSVVYQLRRDSVFLHDSVAVNTYTRGDTVFSERYKTRTEYRDILRRDTVGIVRRDTVAVPYRVTETVYRRRWYDRLCAAVCLALLPFAAVRLWKKFLPTK